jgi:hypothetical protein
MLFLHQQNNLDTSDNFALPKTISEKLLNSYLGFISAKMVQKKLISIFDESIITLCLQFKSIFADVFGYQWRVYEKRMMNYGQKS